MNNNIKEPIGKYISQIYRKGRAFISKGLTQYDMGYGQMLFLLQLYNQDGISQEELTEKLNIDKGTTARSIKKLEKEGFIIRLKDEHDKRAYKIYLTDKSKEKKDDICNVLQEWESILTENITEEERHTLINILKKICLNKNKKIGGLNE